MNSVDLFVSSLYPARCHFNTCYKSWNLPGSFALCAAWAMSTSVLLVFFVVVSLVSDVAPAQVGSVVRRYQDCCFMRMSCGGLANKVSVSRSVCWTLVRQCRPLWSSHSNL